MKTVTQLQGAGFTVQPAKDATGCTEVLSDKPFWFYNPRFHSDMPSIQANLKAAERHGDMFRLLAAGLFAGAAQFPFALVDSTIKSTLDGAFQGYLQMQEGAKKWTASYLATVASNLPQNEVPA